MTEILLPHTTTPVFIFFRFLLLVVLYSAFLHGIILYYIMALYYLLFYAVGAF